MEEKTHYGHTDVQNKFGSMPLMLLSKVFYYLDQTDLNSCCQVSQWWNQVALRPSTWRSLNYNYDIASIELAKHLGRTICPFVTILTVDTSISATQLRMLLKRAVNLRCFIQVECRFSRQYTLTMKAASNADILASLSASCIRLQELVLVQSSDITSSSLEAFASCCTQLQRLDVGKSCLSPECCTIVSQMWPGLVSFVTCRIKMTRTARQLNPASLLTLARCPLRELMLTVKNIDADTICQAILKCPNLERFVCVSVDHAWPSQDNLVQCLANTCRNLRTVCLPDCAIEKADAFQSLLVSCPDVESATLVAGPDLSQRSLQLIGMHWKQLRELIFSASFAVDNDVCLTNLGTGCRYLKRLHLSFTAGFSASDGLKDLLTSCQYLSDLKLVLPQPRDRSPLAAILSARPNHLRKLFLSINNSSKFSNFLSGPDPATPNLSELTLSRMDPNPELIKNLVDSAAATCNLKSLCLTNCIRLTDTCLASLGCLPNLTEIRLYKLKLITNYSLLRLSETKAKNQLRVLSLHNGYLDDNLTNAAFDYFARFTALKSLELRFWSCLTDDGVAKLAGSDCARSLTSLTVTGSALVTEAAWESLKQHRQLSFKFRF